MKGSTKEKILDKMNSIHNKRIVDSKSKQQFNYYHRLIVQNNSMINEFIKD